MEFEEFSRIVENSSETIRKTYIWPGTSDIPIFDLDIALNDTLCFLHRHYEDMPKNSNGDSHSIEKLITMHLSGEPYETLRKAAPPNLPNAIIKILILSLDHTDCHIFFILALRENSLMEVFAESKEKISQIAQFLSELAIPE